MRSNPPRRLHPPAWFAAIGRAVVRLVDLILVRVYGIWCFSRAPGCIYRLSWVRAPVDHTFADGTKVSRGERILNLHIWNERLPAAGPAGPDLAWGRAMYANTVQSFRLLSAYLDSSPQLAAVHCLWGEMAFGEDERTIRRLLTRLGMEVTEAPGGRVYRFWANLWSWLLMWLYSPTSARGRSFLDLRRYHLWVSRSRLREQYGETVGR